MLLQVGQVTPGHADDGLISQGRPTTASSVEDSTLTADKAVDGGTTTRWASAEGSDPQWIRVDLGDPATISRVRLSWEAAYARAYRVEVSADGATWTTLSSTSAGDGGVDDLTVTGSGRYVRVYGTARATSYGYSLWELEVYGKGGGGDGSFVVAAAGDIAGNCRAGDGTACPHERTARLVESINPVYVLTMGDNQYDDGKLSEYRSYYATTWGRFKTKTRPTPGNHEYYDPAGGASGYKAYFGSIATPGGKTYYSFDHGNWHFVALDSEQSMSAGSAQVTWLKSDLARTTRKCVAAYWHHPLFNSGSKGYDPVSLPVWRALYAAGADLILNGHDHVYERFRPQDPDGKATAAGPLAVTAGLGGAENYTFEHEVHPNSLVRLTDLHGVLKLTLTGTGFSGQLVQDDGRIRDTIPATACH
ncbi:discoidin domain-containing protein [Nonomuraea sp. SMC257]|uniref:Discoidin domain-containing protein n=2 Tax=Nonomuraea montanisoli TaxID=2741721 RepID=A0A7Y6M437_9ACTN|nr:discoidin domain-containing protein [Nonomuraea montanisoli]